jgi:hypothetical protein
MLTRNQARYIYKEFSKTHPALEECCLTFEDEAEDDTIASTRLFPLRINVNPKQLAKITSCWMKISFLHELGHVYEMVENNNFTHNQSWYNRCRKLGWSLRTEYESSMTAALPKKYQKRDLWPYFIKAVVRHGYYIPYAIRKKVF